MDGQRDEADDGLGYYDDGVKRTLTDEQIAIFRHSEIQTLLRERRLQREADPDETHANLQNATSIEQDVQAAEDATVELEPSERRPSEIQSMSADLSQSDTTDANVAAVRKEPWQKKKKRVQKNKGWSANKKRRLDRQSMNRVARELDEANHEDVELEY